MVSAASLLFRPLPVSYGRLRLGGFQRFKFSSSGGGQAGKTRRTAGPSGGSSIVVSDRAAAHATQLALLTPLQKSRRAERARFGAPVNALLAVGLLGAGFVVRWISQNRADEWEPPSRRSKTQQLLPNARVTEQAEVEALLGEVRVVLGRLGISLGKVMLPVQLSAEFAPGGLEGSTTKVIRPPPLLRGIEAVSLRPGLTAISAAQVLAHEYTHCWLWLQQFPPLDVRLEEGLCELLSYLYLLSRLREPPGESAVLARDDDALQQQIWSIEANAHPDYGGGFRECVAALRGRSLHELLGFVRATGRLPPALAEPEQEQEESEVRIYEDAGTGGDASAPPAGVTHSSGASRRSRSAAASS